jgi:UDP-N-acetyl-D-galactosamine dehydrogenase
MLTKNKTVYQKLITKKNKISVIGLGYVGLPLALEFAKKFTVIGFDINENRIGLMRDGVDPSNELEGSAFDNKDLVYTSAPEDLEEAQFHVIAVPTPVDQRNIPNLTPVYKASETVGKVLKKGDYVIYESTVYPGCTEEDCVPILEKLSGLKQGVDFKVGYSPERINPGDKEHTVEKILKIVSGSDEEATEQIAKVYGEVILAGVYKAGSIKVAEAAKVIENTQRDINIAFMNELAVIFDKLNIDTTEVLEAAGTKWNFINFRPGLVGGHCIGVDPYYLLFKANEIGYTPQMITSGRKLNDDMPAFIAKRLTQLLIKKGKNPSNCKVLVKGITFKENVSDIRNSKVSDLIKELKEFSIKVDIVDPHASNEEVKHEYGLELSTKPESNYDAVIVAVNHDEYKKLDADYFTKLMNGAPILMDLKSIYDKSMEKVFTYWRL